MKKIEISIIVPVYNCTKYLSVCVESILKQSFNDFELILVDDGSRDSSGEICDMYASKDDRIVVVHKENAGVSRARQTGIDLARGRYITFIDSDDYIKEDYLEVLYNNAEENCADLVCCNCEETGIYNAINLSIKEDEIVTNNKKLMETFFEKRRYLSVVWCKLYKKEMFENAVFPDLKYAEDSYMLLSMIPRWKKVVLLTYVGYYYRRQEESATINFNQKQSARDVLEMSRYANGICSKYYPDLLYKAMEHLYNYLFGGVSYILRTADKKEIEEFHDYAIKYYKYIDFEKFNKKYVKNLVLKLFYNKKYAIKYFLKVIYVLKK